MLAGWIVGLVFVGFLFLHVALANGEHWRLVGLLEGFVLGIFAFAGFLRLLDVPKIKQKREERQREREYENWNATHGL